MGAGAVPPPKDKMLGSGQMKAGAVEQLSKPEKKPALKKEDKPTEKEGEGTDSAVSEYESMHPMKLKHLAIKKGYKESKYDKKSLITFLTTL